MNRRDDVMNEKAIFLGDRRHLLDAFRACHCRRYVVAPTGCDARARPAQCFCGASGRPDYRMRNMTMIAM